MEHEVTMSSLTKVTAEGQIAIPAEIRAALRVHPGDLIAWEVAADGRQALVRPVPAPDIEYLRAVQGTLDEEWSGAADDAAYRDL